MQQWLFTAGCISFDEAKAVGKPMEVALLVAAAKAGLYRDEVVSELPESREEAFDSDVMMMATFHEREEDYQVAVKGAPDWIGSGSGRRRPWYHEASSS